MAWMFDGRRRARTPNSAIAVRNPYYFKVDTEGTQLPYFDRIVYQMVADPQVLLLKTLQGEIDMMDQYIGTPTNKPVLFDGQAKGNYGFYTLKETAANVMVFQLNLNHTDPVKNKLFNNTRLPPGHVGRGRPPGADRRGVRRAGRAGAALDPRGRSALQRAAGQAAHRVRSRRGQRDARRHPAEQGR